MKHELSSSEKVISGHIKKARKKTSEKCAVFSLEKPAMETLFQLLEVDSELTGQ